jgi:hypothetical protein
VAAASTIRWGPAPESYASWRRCITPTNPATAPLARAPSSGSSSARRVASRKAICSIAAKPSSAATVASPTPRLGVFTTRRALITSCGFSRRRRYARTSLISLRW